MKQKEGTITGMIELQFDNGERLGGRFVIEDFDDPKETMKHFMFQVGDKLASILKRREEIEGRVEKGEDWHTVGAELYLRDLKEPLHELHKQRVDR